MLHGAAWDLNDSRILNSIRDFTDNYNTAPRHHATPQIIPREIVCVSLDSPPWAEECQCKHHHHTIVTPAPERVSSQHPSPLFWQLLISLTSAWLWEYLLTLSINEIAFYFLWSWMKWPIGRDSIQSLCSDDQIYWGPGLTMQCMAPQISGHSLTYPGQWARDSDRVQGLPVWHHCEHNMRAVMWAALQESGEGTWINWSPSYSLISSHWSNINTDRRKDNEDWWE